MPHRSGVRQLRALIAVTVVSLVSAPRLAAQRADSTLTVERIFGTPEFAAERLDGARWRPGLDAYTRLEQAPGSAVPSLVQYDAESGRRAVILPASRLVPTGATEPIEIEEYDWSPDGKRLLLFTYSG
jgi:dipeptidyl-peptidase-4